MFWFIRNWFGPRRIKFLFWYLSALARSKEIKRLLPVIENSFAHPWTARVDLKIRFSPGEETRLCWLWRMFRGVPKSDLMHWDAPITVSIFRKRRGKERQALCMSLYVRAAVLNIAQLQGTLGTDVPEELRPWPKIFIEACKKFVFREGLRELRVPKAGALASYRYPYGRLETLTQDQQKAVPRIRRNMELLYDRNALDLGLVPNGDWFTWENAAATVNTRATALRRAFSIAVPPALIAVTTVVLSYMQTDVRALIYFYLLPLALVAALYKIRTAIACSVVAVLCADYFLLDPIYSFYASDYGNLVWFAAAAALAIIGLRLLPLHRPC